MTQEYYEDLVAVCTECHSDLPDSYVNKNVFYKNGGDIPCVFCGGVARVVNKTKRETALRQADQKRGVDVTHNKKVVDGKVVSSPDDTVED